jgi:transposase
VVIFREFSAHVAGEWLFVDHAGDGVPVVIDRLTGEIRKAQIFVAVLGASSFTFAWAGWTQALPDRIDAHVRVLDAIGGVPQLLVPDIWAVNRDRISRANITKWMADPKSRPE